MAKITHLILAVAGLANFNLAQQETFHFKGNPYSALSDVSRDTIRINVPKYFRDHQNATITIPRPDYKISGDFYLPNKPGKYPVINWVGGMYSVFPKFLYTDIIEKMTKKGFIVIYNCGLGAFENSDKWLNQLDWDNTYANQIIQDYTNGTITADFTKYNSFCHSSGCWNLKIYSMVYPDLFSSYYYSDPVINNSYNDTETGLDIYSAKILTNGLLTVDNTEACGRCCVWQRDNQMILDSYPNANLRIAEQLDGVGHCTMLTYFNYNLCKKTKFCKTPKASLSEVRKYHSCTAGKMTAFYVDAMFDDVSMRKYYQNVNNYCRNMVSNFECVGEYCI